MISAQTRRVCREGKRDKYGAGFLRIMLPRSLRVNLNSSPRREMTRASAAKNRAGADSFIPPSGDFGYAGAR
jgi:hypothetical protein